MAAAHTIAGWPIEADTKLSKSGVHLDVPYSISNHGRLEDGLRGEEGTYCYYVSIFEDMLPEGVFAKKFWLRPIFTECAGRKRVSYPYMTAAFSDAAWNYGITYYEKLGGHDGNLRGVKMGCDYAHHWDSRFYTLADVEADCRRTIEKLHLMFPLYRRCVRTSVWMPEEQLIELDGRLWSPEAHAKRIAEKAAEEVAATGSAS